MAETLQRYQELGIDLSKGLLKAQLELVLSAIRSESIGEDLRLQLDNCFRRIVKCLIGADKEIKAVYQDRSKGRIKYFLGDKVKLKSRLKELEEQRETFMRLASYVHWQQTAPSPSLLTKHQCQFIHETKNQQAGQWLRTSDICAAKCKILLNGGGSRIVDVVVERRFYTSDLKAETEGDIRVLAGQLQLARSSEGILDCIGYRQNPYGEFYELLFELPACSYRHSLADCITFDPTPTLCKQLARAVSGVHSIRIVHKNIRPRNILLI